MRFRAYCVLVVALLSIVGPLTGCVEAAVSVREVTLDMGSSLGYDLDIDKPGVNAGNYRPASEFKDVLDHYDYKAQGIYWGNRLPLYKVHYPFYDMRMAFNISFNVSRSDIQLGAGGYWLRLPVDGNYVSKVEIVRGCYSIYNYPVATDNNMIAFFYNHENVTNAIFDSSGIYCYLRYPLFPGLNNLSFFFTPKPGKAIPAYVGNEEYSVNSGAYWYFTLRNDYQPGYSAYTVYNSQCELLPSSVPISFLFCQGLDSNGFSSQWIDAGNTLIFSGRFHPLADALDGLYPYVYMPFRCDYEVDFNIKWEITDITYNLGFQNPVGGGCTFEKEANYINQRDYILASCPYYLNESAFSYGGLKTNHAFTIYITPSVPVLLLFRRNLDNDGLMLDEPFGLEGYEHNYYSFFFVHELGGGIWSRITQYDGISIVDTGFAWGYRYPGLTEVYFFYDSGAKTYFNGTIDELWRFILEPSYTLQDAHADAVKGAIRWLADDYLANLYTLGGNVLSFANDLIDGLIYLSKVVRAIIESVIDYISAISKMLPVFMAVVLVEMVAFIYVKKVSLTDFKRDMQKGFNRLYQKGVTQETLVRRYQRIATRANIRALEAEGRARAKEIDIKGRYGGD